MLQIFAIAVGGAAGALSRHVLSGWAAQRLPQFAASGTLVVNVLGCLLIGIVVAATEGRANAEPWRALIVTGFLGSLTTFSTFGFQTIALLELHAYRAALLNVAANLALGLPAVVIGLTLGAWLRP